MSFFSVFESFIWPFLLAILFYLLSRKRRDAIAALLESSVIRLLLLMSASLMYMFLGLSVGKSYVSYVPDWVRIALIAAAVTVTGLGALLAGFWLGVRLGSGGSLRPLLALLIYPFNIFYAPIPIVGCLLGVWLSQKERFSKYSYRIRTGNIRPFRFIPVLLIYALILLIYNLIFWGSPTKAGLLPPKADLPPYLYLVIAVAVLFLAGAIFVLAEKVLLKVVKKKKPIEAIEIESKPELEKEKPVETAEIEGKPVAGKGRLGKARVILSVVLLFFGFLSFYGIGSVPHEFFGRGGDPGIAGMIVGPIILIFFSIGSVLILSAGLLLRKRWGWKIFNLLAAIAIIALVIGYIIGYIQASTEIAQQKKIEAEKRAEAEFLVDAITLKEGSPGVLWAMAADDYRVYENIVYLVNGRNLSAVDIEYGRKLWTTELPTRPSLNTGDPFYITSEVIVLKAAGEEGEKGEGLMAIDAQTGKVKSPNSITADIYNDRFVAYDIKSGEEKWTFKPPHIPPRDKDQDVSVVPQYLYLDEEVVLVELYSTAWAVSAGNDIYVLDVQSGKMKLHYKNSLGKGARINDMEAIHRVDGLLIFQSVVTEPKEKRAVQALDLEDGKERWSFQREYITDVRVNIKDGTVELWDGREEVDILDYRVDNYYALDLLTGKVKSKISSKKKPAPSTIKAEIEKEIEINDEMSPAYFAYKGKKYKSPSKISSDIEYMFVEPLYGGEYLIVMVGDHIYYVKP